MRHALGACALLGAIGCATEAHPADAAVVAAASAVEPLRSLAELDPASCASCHASQAEEWRTSAHARAFVDPLFAAEWNGGSSFCADCHAPRAGDPSREPELARLGVDCASCHVEDGVVHSGRVSGEAPHSSAADPSFDGVALCARCHQFDFERQPLPLQDTVAEWERSGVVAACPRCHAPRRDEHTLHSFPGHRSPELLARALAVEGSAARDGWSTDVVLQLRADRVGHAVPTGDVFRRLQIRAWIDGREENAATAWLGRRFERTERGEWIAGEDERVPPPGHGRRVVALRIADSGERVRWQIDLWSLDPRSASRVAPDVPLHAPMTSGVIELAPRAMPATR